MGKLLALFVLSNALASVSSVSITEIQGTAFSSPLTGKTVHNVTGVVVAKASDGFYLVGDKSDDVRASNGLFIFTSSAPSAVDIGDAVSLSGRVTEFRAASTPNNLFLTEITNPANITKLSTNNVVTPVVLGRDRFPPTRYFSSLDVGPDGFLSIPNNSSRVQVVNATLQPDKYGLDFWESLEGQLVTIPGPIVTNFQNNFGEFWVYGRWPVTGRNNRGGLTITFGPDGIPDGNPEAILIDNPLDGTTNPQVAMGVGLSDITGVVTYQFGFYYVVPLTAPTVISRPKQSAQPTTLEAKRTIIDRIFDRCAITFGDYNVENLAPNSRHLPTIAKHIVDYLRTPDFLFLQEIQDDSGPTDDGTVSANLTLATLANAIRDLSGVRYSFAQVDPVDGQDGGQPGGNIRTAFMFKPEVLKLVNGSPVGGSRDPVAVEGRRGKPKLNFNPGRIEPAGAVWNATRKPLVAHWETSFGQELFTVNLHLSSKGGSSSTQGDARPPVNNPIESRTAQVSSVANFVKAVLDRDSNANIVVAGDFNEFIHTRSVYKPIVQHLTDIDEAARIPQEERYSYLFDQNAQQLDHALVSSSIRRRKVEFEHIHINTWAPSLSERISDHDPSVGKIRLC
ncbi:endonuclease/exonuclease/phosphatase, variant 2 [Coprinopsis cinerea AmutBmut pab1-1]|nr:endonuclease/exonuclease/phosphatase, variant 2 [Coprinopsis cinerea AmutBmut pab1-1]